MQRDSDMSRVAAKTPAEAKRLTFIDLFCGCGGFSLGMQRAGFRCLAAVDNNHEAIAVFAANFPNVPHALEKDLAKFSPDKLAVLLGGNTVDVIVGGPPCQGFSNVRKVDWSNHGSRVRRDKRRYLYREFLRYVQYFRPKAFVMENVLGIQSAAKGKFFTAVQAEARALGYRVHAQVEEAWTLGVPQKRRRQLIIGVRADVPGYFPTRLLPSDRASFNLNDPGEPPTLGDAIGDLPPLAAGGGVEERDYDLARREVFLTQRGERGAHYLNDVLEVGRAKKLTAHRARPHSERDLRDFARLREGEHSAEAIARGEAMEFTYDRESFKDRFKRQHRGELCSTIVAHLSKDGLMFIHPTQNRSLTPREVARVQSFPDWFEFPVCRTHQFRIIGNAVPPLVAEAVGLEVKQFLIDAMNQHSQPKFELAPLPVSEIQAIEWLLPLLDLPRRALREMPSDEFKRAWYSIAFIYAGLHPDGALDHGKTTSRDVEDHLLARRADPRLLAPYYERSGWPVILADIANEAWRRNLRGDLADEEFYCSDAQLAGMCCRNRWMAEEQIAGRKEIAA
jgi:DNA (cytosine-5)-methyltransferase 1